MYHIVGIFTTFWGAAPNLSPMSDFKIIEQNQSGPLKFITISQMKICANIKKVEGV